MSRDRQFSVGWDQKSVLVTGHTGFKGSWLSLWLHQLGCRVTGYSLDPPTTPNHFHAAHIDEILERDIRADIRDASSLQKAMIDCAPDIVFHLAAQPIVRESLAEPRETFDVNVVGTASVLDAVRNLGRPCVVIVITSDKCYRNEGSVWGFRENDPLGGHDPYSASKAGSELVVESYRQSYFPVDAIDQHGVRLASARAGNVIGGGDWASDRIVPDAMRSLASGSELIVRNPASTRPWQHVLEPLSGYLALAEKLMGEQPEAYAEAWNFGPVVNDEANVATLATALVQAWGSGSWTSPNPESSDVEAKTLRIAIDKAVSKLDWQPRWHLNQTVQRTVDWYKSYYAEPSKSQRETSLRDIADYEAAGASPHAI